MNGSIRKLEKTNLTYIEKNITKTVRSVNDLNMAIKALEYSAFEIEKEIIHLNM